MSRFRMGTVVAIPRREFETDAEYRYRCRLNPNVIGVALTDALPSEFVLVDLQPPANITYHDTSKD